MKRRPNGQPADHAPGLAPPGRTPPGPDSTSSPSPADTWQDWVTIWQSEMNAWATDREAQLLFARLVEMWAAQARAAGAWFHDAPAGRAGAEPQARPAAAAAAPDAGDARCQQRAIERLAKRVAELERRLAERGVDGKD